MATPDYAAWDLIHRFTPANAAYLFLDLEPKGEQVWSAPPKIKAVGERIMRETGATESPNKGRNAKRTVSRSELKALAKSWGMKPPFLFPDEQNVHSSGGTQLSQSTYWCALERKAQAAIEGYPEWSKGVRRVQKTANLHDWLKKDIEADNREAEIIKKILSDVFQELR